MAKAQKINESYSLNFSSREDGTGDTVMDCNINFDNPHDMNYQTAQKSLVNQSMTTLKNTGRKNSWI